MPLYNNVDNVSNKIILEIVFFFLMQLIAIKINLKIMIYITSSIGNNKCKHFSFIYAVNCIQKYIYLDFLWTFSRKNMGHIII